MSKRKRPIRAATHSTTSRKPRQPAHSDKFSAFKVRTEELIKDNRLDEAQEQITQALALRPDDFDARLIAGRVAVGQGRYIDGLKLFDQLLQEDLKRHEPHFLSALSLYQLGQFQPALAHIKSAISLNPESDADYLFLKGTILTALHRLSEAEPVFEDLLNNHSRQANFLNNAGNLYRSLGHLDKAEKLFREAMALDPTNSYPYSNLLTSVHYDPNRSREEIHKICLEWESKYAPKRMPMLNGADKLPSRSIRIGMISDGFSNHPVGRMIIASLERLPKGAFSFFAYSSAGKADAITNRFKRISQYEITNHLSDRQLAEKIRADQIDILFDLSGHNSGMRMPVMAMKPAPVQVKWVGGLINTTGVSSIDYLISDNIETPEGEDAYYTEKLIRMPGDYVCYEMPDHTPDVTALPAKTNGFITLGCFNNPMKINPQILEQWAMIMHKLANSHLFLKGHQFSAKDLQERVWAELEQQGISRDRVIIEGPSPHKELLASYNRVDIALDPWPYSGGLTTCEAFVMGVPVVTMPGPTFAGRHSATHLVNAGMPELVTHSWDEYRARVIELASDLDSLATIRSHLRTILLQSPVCDADAFAGHLNNALRAIWQRYCEGKQPEALSFNEQGEVLFADETEPMQLQHPEAPPEPEAQQTFKWEFEGKVIAIDHGGQLMDVPVIKQMLDAGTLELIAFDPASHHLKHPLRQVNGVHYYPNVLLGNGKPTTLYACQSASLSGTLKPMPSADNLPKSLADGLNVLAELPINSLALDAVSELPRIDWLVLDDLNNSLDVLEQGSNALKNALLLHADITFQPTHQRQPNLTEISHWAARQGFRFYCFSDEEHRTHVSQRIVGANRYANELIGATALFIPSYERLSAMGDNERRKLAFIADTAYGLEGLAYEALGFNSTNEATQYIDHQTQKYINKLQPHVPKQGIRAKPNVITRVDRTETDGLVVRPELTLPATVAEHLRQIYSSANNILEYGSGGSTVLASEMQGKRIFTVENDLAWADKMRRYIAQEPHPSPAIIHSVNTGPTAAWARPVDDSGWRNFHAYPLSVWDRDDFVEPDVVLIDGRFRIACFVATFMKIKKPTIVLFDDYADRDYYHVVERLAKPVKIIGRMAHFELLPTEIPREQLTWMIDSFNHVTYADNMRR